VVVRENAHVTEAWVRFAPVRPVPNWPSSETPSLPTATVEVVQVDVLLLALNWHCFFVHVEAQVDGLMLAPVIQEYEGQPPGPRCG